VAVSAACLCGLARLDASVPAIVGAMARRMFAVVEAALKPVGEGVARVSSVQQQAIGQLPRCVRGARAEGPELCQSQVSALAFFVKPPHHLSLL
jgi:hypothetical protein